MTRCKAMIDKLIGRDKYERSCFGDSGGDNHHCGRLFLDDEKIVIWIKEFIC